MKNTRENGPQTGGGDRRSKIWPKTTLLSPSPVCAEKRAVQVERELWMFWSWNESQETGALTEAPLLSAREVKMGEDCIKNIRENGPQTGGVDRRSKIRPKMTLLSTSTGRAKKEGGVFGSYRHAILVG